MIPNDPTTIEIHHHGAAAVTTATFLVIKRASFHSSLQASWNWRFKFPLVLQHDSRMRRLTLQLFDRDITVDDLAGQIILPLDPWLKRVYKRQVRTVWQSCSLRFATRRLPRNLPMPLSPKA